MRSIPLADRVRVRRRESVCSGYLRVDRYHVSHRLYAGGFSQALVREVLERGHVAAVLPYDPVADAVVLIEQFRPGALAAGVEPWLLECVAGIIEPGETAEEMIAREAVEECGCRLRDMVLIHQFFPTPGICSESVALYCGRVDASSAGGIFGLAEEGEDILAFTAGMDEVKSLLDTGRIVNSITIVALQWLLLHRTELRAKWN